MRVNVTAPERTKIKSLVEKDAILSAMMTATMPQIDTWLDANMTTLAEARNIMKRLVKVIVFLLREEI
jgi:hypothetical protein